MSERPLIIGQCIMEGDEYGKLLVTIARRVAECLSACYEHIEVNDALINSILNYLEEPPREEYGDLALPLPRLRSLGLKDIMKYGDAIAECVQKLDYIKYVRRIGAYVNFVLKEEFIASSIKEQFRNKGDTYGLVKNPNPQRVVVEFVSANPIHPLHIGSGRNAALGEFVARILEKTGNIVERRYYVDDLGLQVAYLAYGYMLLNRPKVPPNMKVDHFLGLIYAATATIVDIRRLKEEAEKAKQAGNTEEYSRIMNEITKLLGDLQRIREKLPGVVDELIDRINSEDNPIKSINEIMRKHEFGDPQVSNLVKEVCSLVLEGIKETLKIMGVKIDVWDWESDLVREGLVRKIIEEAKRSPYITIHKGALALDFSTLLKDASIRKELGIPEGLEVPPLILVRSDGTTLYTTRDIAYTIKKFREFKADKVVNVIAIEQTLPQAQLRLALYALGYRREARNLIHYSYEMVNLPGKSMSGRRGRYVTVDELIDSLIENTKLLMRERGVEANEDTLIKIARSALKYMMLSTSPKKVVVFDVSKALDISRNSAPYLQYTYARANAVLEKYSKEIDWDGVDLKAFTQRHRRRLLLLIYKFPHVVSYVARYLSPEDLITYLNKVADVFNSWYDIEPILREPNEGVRNAKLLLTYGVKLVIGNGLDILGLDVLQRV